MNRKKHDEVIFSASELGVWKRVEPRSEVGI